MKKLDHTSDITCSGSLQFCILHGSFINPHPCRRATAKVIIQGMQMVAAIAWSEPHPAVGRSGEAFWPIIRVSSLVGTLIRKYMKIPIFYVEENWCIMSGTTVGWKGRKERRKDWMNKWMNEGMNGWMKEWMNERKNEWVNERKNEWMNERKKERKKEWMNEWMNEWANEEQTKNERRTNEPTNQRMNERTNEQTNKRTNEWRIMKEWMN